MGIIGTTHQFTEEEIKEFELNETEGYLDVEKVKSRIISRTEYRNELVTSL